MCAIGECRRIKIYAQQNRISLSIGCVKRNWKLLSIECPSSFRPGLTSEIAGYQEPPHIFLSFLKTSRVDDWRSGCRSRGVAVRRQLSHIAGASIRTVAPFPVAARQTGRADFPHPAFSRPVKSSLLAGRCGFAGRCRGRASHKDTRPGSGRTRCLCVPIAVATSDGFVARCICG